MGFFCDTHYDDEGEEHPFEFDLSQHNYRYDTSGRNAYIHRLLSPSYIHALSLGLSYKSNNNAYTHEQKSYLSNKQKQVIYKNIGARSGVNALTNLMDYLSRDLNHQVAAKQENATLYNSDHEAIDQYNYQDCVSAFSEEFDAEQSHKDYQYLMRLLEDRKRERLKLEDVKFDIWRENTTVRFRDNWAQEATITEVCDNDFVKVNYNTKDGELADYIQKSAVVPTVTPENFSIFDQSKAKNPEKMLIADDDPQYSIHKKVVQSFEKQIPKDFHHLMFSFAGSDYPPQVGHSAFKDFLDTTLKDRGFDFIYTKHKDTQHEHYHVICQNKSSLHPGKRFPTGKEDSFILRKELNTHLFRNGIDRSVTRMRDRVFDYQPQKSLAEKLNDYSGKKAVQKNDIEEFKENVLDHISVEKWSSYTDEDKKAVDEILTPIIKQCTPENAKETIEKAIEQSKDMDRGLHNVLREQYHQKTALSNDVLDRNKEYLAKKLEQTQEVVEKHPYELSSPQRDLKDRTEYLLYCCRGSKKEKAKAKDTQKEQGNNQGLGLSLF